jgi:uncharacterized repeat protein (TIGR03806 family)
VTGNTLFSDAILPYDINSPLWSDGATKARGIYIPVDSKIDVLPDGDFELPNGSVAVKTFSVDDKKVETRLFARYADGVWAGFSYEWDADEREATLLAGSKTKALPNGQTWYFPSRSECSACHTPAAGFTLGLETRQLDRREGNANQLERFGAVFAQPIVPGTLPPLRSPDDSSASVADRARSYLHSNCSGCHRPGAGSGAATIDLRFETALANTRTCNVAPQAGALGLVEPKILAPGSPTRSILLNRMRSLDVATGRMPPLGSRVVDTLGSELIQHWIEGVVCP